MHRWQRLLSFWVVGICLCSGLIWFIALDGLQLPVPSLRAWWILHGCSSLLSLVLVGAALPQHLVVTWKARRNRLHGLIVLAGFGAALLSALGLFYAPEQWRDLMHWMHCVSCLILALAFPLHIVRARLQQRGH